MFFFVPQTNNWNTINKKVLKNFGKCRSIVGFRSIAKRIAYYEKARVLARDATRRGYLSGRCEQHFTEVLELLRTDVSP